MRAAPPDSPEQLVLRERQCRDRGWFGEMSECYLEDSRVRLSWYSGSGRSFCEASGEMAGQGARTTHRMGAPVVRRSGSRYFVEAPAEIIFALTGDVPSYLISWARLAYRVERRAGGFGIAALDVIYERDELVPPSPSSDSFPRSSYARLAAHLRSIGYPVALDLLGDDRPEEVASFYDESALWLHGG